MARINVKLKDENDEYELYSRNTSDQEIKVVCQFTAWRKERASELKITKNNYDELEIFQVDSITGKKCDEDGNCNELHLKAKRGTTTVNKTFQIKNTCDFEDTEVYVILFSEKEIEQGMHEKELCSDCFDSPQIPETSEGNILVGE